MRCEFTREELYDLVWSRPIRSLAEEQGISDAALIRSLRKHHIPLPPRRHWADLEAGAATARAPLPERDFGASAVVRLGRGEGDDPPAAPEFPADAAALARRAAALVGEVAIPRDLGHPHPVIAQLLHGDDRRRPAAGAGAVSIFDRPLFAAPFERRRLRFLSGLFLALRRCAVRIVARGPDPAAFDAVVGETLVRIEADRPDARRLGWRGEAEAALPAETPMTVRVRPPRRGGPGAIWRDRPGAAVEDRAAEIAVAVVLCGEFEMRAQALRRCGRRVGPFAGGSGSAAGTAEAAPRPRGAGGRA